MNSHDLTVLLTLNPRLDGSLVLGEHVDRRGKRQGNTIEREDAKRWRVAEHEMHTFVYDQVNSALPFLSAATGAVLLLFSQLR